MVACRAAEAAGAAALVVEVAAIARQATLAGATTAIDRGDIGCDARTRKSRLTVSRKASLANAVLS
jgi:hypothetical protein